MVASTRVNVTPELVRRLDVAGPRYTSYPTADRFCTSFDSACGAVALAAADTRVGAPLGLYIHLPFCPRICTYCGCTVLATRNPDKISAYVDLIIRELSLVAERLPHRKKLGQLHLGGGTPNHVAMADIARLMGAVGTAFDILPGAEIAAEIDPRLATEAQLAELARLGFNRVSFGVQDIAEPVQEAIGRYQSEAVTRNAVVWARAAGFKSVNVDLVYGLPAQTPESFAKTLASLIVLRPDRVALFAFAFMPWLKPNQQGIDKALLPDPDTRIGFLLSARETLIAAGYEAIGMDHFAMPHDALAKARGKGALRRTFQGYTVMPENMETIGLGLSAIGDLDGTYIQNTKDLAQYRAAIEAGRLPIERGHSPSRDDRVRRFIIQRLTCDFELSTNELRRRFGVELPLEFAPELEQLRKLEADGLVSVTPERVVVTELGRLFVRAVAMPFDRYLREKPREATAYSRVV